MSTSNMDTSNALPPPPMSPRKDSGGDPLFDAALRSHGRRNLDELCSSPSSPTTIILTEHQPRRPSDPNFEGLLNSSVATTATTTTMSGSGSAPPAMHTYYNEFRLGHGDPLIKAAMKRWPCATTDYSLPECPDSPKIHNQRKQMKLQRAQGSPVSVSCRTLSESVPRDLVNVPTSSNMWPFVDIVELDHLNLEQACVKERRFVMLDGQGHTVAEAEDDVEELYSDFQQQQEN
mmetsp:Transcript_43333/g.105008  ORF Transcript_43333/g.105008 Transcript_43333/m.105008 type:complete len:233 (+) Transcript_43333:332-1030(+)